MTITTDKTLLIAFIEGLEKKLKTDPEFWNSEEFEKGENDVYLSIFALLDSKGQDFTEEDESFILKATQEERLQLYKVKLTNI